MPPHVPSFFDDPDNSITTLFGRKRCNLLFRSELASDLPVHLLLWPKTLLIHWRSPLRSFADCSLNMCRSFPPSFQFFNINLEKCYPFLELLLRGVNFRFYLER